jgi:metal-dependent amidase/aminoacylase/carboxypeptidase family protein
MAIVSGLAAELSTNPIKKGKAILLYQPEEENGQGAAKSIQRLKELNLYPDYSFAIHNMPKHPLGSIVIGEYTFASASKGLIIKLIGKDSHAAYPEKGINPAMAISEIIQGLNELTKQKFFSSFVLLTIIHIRVGEIAFGTSPGYGEIMVTLRSFANSDMEILSKKTIDLSKSIGTKYGLMVETAIADDYPAATCDKELTSLLKSIAKEQERQVVVLKEPNRWSEDFSNFTLHGPSIIFGLGVGESVPDLHSPDYDFPDEAIEHGIAILVDVVNKFLR